MATTTTYTTTITDGTFVNILDGVAGSMTLTNKASGGTYYSSSRKLLTKSKATEGALLALPITSDASTDWHKTATTAEATGTAPDYTVKVSYTGSALAAMPNGANPAGWSFIQQPWEVWDAEGSGVQTGYVDTQSVGIHYGNGVHFHDIPEPRLYFVPNFLFEAASTTPSVVDGTTQVWSLYLAKPLNCNQRPTITVTTPMFGGSTTLASTPVYNAYGQLVRVDAVLPLSVSHPSQAANTIRVQAPMTLKYLKGNTIVTETIPYDKTFNVTVSSGTDSTPPVISDVRILSPSDLSGDPDAAKMMYAVYNTFVLVGGILALSCTASDAGLSSSGLDRAELWAAPSNDIGTLVGTPEKVATYALSGAKGPTTFRFKWDTATWGSNASGYSGRCGGTSLTVKVYDLAGNVSSLDLWAGLFTGSPFVYGGISVSGSGSATTPPVYSTVTGWGAQVTMAPSFVKKVEFTVNGTAVDASQMKTTTVWNKLLGPVTTYYLPHSVYVTSVLGVNVTDLLGNVHTSSVDVTVYYGGGGSGGGKVVDLNMNMNLDEAANRLDTI